MSFPDHPTHIEFGSGCLERLGPILLQQQIKRVAIICGSSMQRLGYLDNLLNHLHSHGISANTHVGVPEEPFSADVDDICGRIKGEPQLVIGMGGGSVMDLVKFVAYLLVHPGKCAAFDGGGSSVQAAGLPTVMIPTTAGTGSEVTPYSVINNSETGKKFTITSPHLYPKWAFIDPQLTTSLPWPYQLATALDAMVHCLEAYLSAQPHAAADGPALEGFQLVLDHLKQGGAERDRAALARAATLGGIAISHSRTGMIHTCSVALAKHCKHPHGLLNAIITPYVLAFNRDSYDSERLHKLFRTSGNAQNALNRLANFYESLDIPTHVKIQRFEMGVLQSLIDRIKMDKGLPAVNSKPFGTEELQVILRQITGEV